MIGMGSLGRKKMWKFCFQSILHCFNDFYYRIGFHYTVTHIASFPILLLRSLARTHGSDRAAVESDIADKLYSSSIYIIILVGF